MKTIQTQTAKTTKIRRLSSDNIRVHTRLKNTKNELQDSSEWTKKIIVSAIIQRRTYTVLTREIKIKNVDIFNQKNVIRQLIEINTRLHVDLKIEKLFWSNRTIKESKIYSSLIIEIVSANTINRLMSDDIIEDFKNKNCEIFVKEYRITQCFNCQQYNYINKACRTQTRCNHCVDSYISWDCTVKTFVRYKRYAVCQHEKYKTWTSKCDVHKHQMRRAHHVYETRLRFFAIETKTTIKSQIKVE